MQKYIYNAWICKSQVMFEKNKFMLLSINYFVWNKYCGFNNNWNFNNMTKERLEHL